MSESLETDWVIVKVRPGAEEVAERHLRQEGYRIYLARYRKMLRPHGDGRKGQPSIRPAFPGYLFCQSWRGWPARPIAGIVGLLMRSGNRPWHLSAEDVALIHQREMAGDFDDARSPVYGKAVRTDLHAGDEVAYQWHGERIVAVLDDLSENGRAILRDIVFDGRRAPVTYLTVDADELELAHK